VTHSIVELLREAEKSARSFEELVDYGKELDRHYIGSRYPNFYPAGAPYEYLHEGDGREMLKLRRVDIERSEEVFKRIEEYKKKVIEKLDPMALILFGSFAKEDINEGSDVDFAVIASHFPL